MSVCKRTPPPWTPKIGEVHRDWNGHLWIGVTDMVAWVGWNRGGLWAWLKERHQKAQRKAEIGDYPT